MLKETARSEKMTSWAGAAKWRHWTWLLVGSAAERKAEECFSTAISRRTCCPLCVPWRVRLGVAGQDEQCKGQTSTPGCVTEKSRIPSLSALRVNNGRETAFTKFCSTSSEVRGCKVNIPGVFFYYLTHSKELPLQRVEERWVAGIGCMWLKTKKIANDVDMDLNTD